MVVFGWFMRNFYCLQSPPSDAILPGLWKNWHTSPWLSASLCTFLRLADKSANCTHPLLKETLPQKYQLKGALPIACLDVGYMDYHILFLYWVHLPLTKKLENFEFIFEFKITINFEFNFEIFVNFEFIFEGFFCKFRVFLLIASHY